MPYLKFVGFTGWASTLVQRWMFNCMSTIISVSDSVRSQITATSLRKCSPFTMGFAPVSLENAL